MAAMHVTDVRADVVIAGAGVAGLVLARALASAAGAGLEVAVVAPRASAPARRTVRAIALGRGSVAMLRALGIWAAVAGEAQAMERIVVTDGRPGGTQLSLLEFGPGTGEGPSAQVIDEAVLWRAAAEAARQCSTVRMVDDEVAGLDAGARVVEVRLESGATMAGTLVVGADGLASPVRSALGIRTVGWGYGQSGIVTVIEHAKDHHGVAVERFLPAGPFALLPLTGKRSAIVWTESEKRARGLMAADDEAFAGELALRVGPERGRVTGVGARASFPLAFHIARRFIAPRAALVGDAAHAVHPLAGQGLNLGLRDVAALAESVVEARRLGLDHGAAPALERYERWRRFDTITSALAYDGLNRLFTNDNDALRTLRDVGLGLVDRLAPLKRGFMREAAGESGDLPRLMAGELL